MPVLPRHADRTADFDAASFAIPLGSGPYDVAEVEPGEKLILQARPALLGAKTCRASAAFINFDTIEIDYCRDHNSLFEALQAPG